MAQIEGDTSERGEVLIVDDTPANLKVLVDLLSTHGYKVRPAVNGRQALAAIEQRSPDLVLLDIRMPGMDGFEVCVEIKANPQWCDIPVIFISAQDSAQDKVRAFEVGGIDYVTKPFEAQEVLARVNTHLRLRRMQRELAEQNQLLEARVAQRTAELAESEAHFRSLVERSPDIVYRYSLTHGNQYTSPRIQDVLGVAPAQLAADPFLWHNSIHPDDRPAVTAVLEKLPQTGEFELEYRIRDAQGAWHWLRDRSVTVEQRDNGDLLIEGIASDITESKQRLQQRRSALHRTIQVVASTLEMRDPYTAGHQRRVAELAVAIAGKLGWDEERIEGLRVCGVLHDIGKIAVPTEILTKPGKLSPVEYELIQGHVQAGYELLHPIDFPWPVAEAVHQHHERLDGSGYPQGLRGEQIIGEARLLAVADVVEAIQTHRPYRASLGIDEALDVIRAGRGRLFDPEAVDACIALCAEDGFAFSA